MTVRQATVADLDAILALRFEVFVDEQKVPPEEERDAHDDTARHFVAEEDGFVVGCARVMEEEDSAHIGRLAVRRSRRGRGIGAAICRFVLADCCARGYSRIWLNAQVSAIGFYEKLGFRSVGDIFLDAGIEHRRMEMTL